MTENTRSTKDIQRSARHLVLPEIGKSGQLKLMASSVFKN